MLCAAPSSALAGTEHTGDRLARRTYLTYRVGNTDQRAVNRSS